MDQKTKNTLYNSLNLALLYYLKDNFESGDYAREKINSARAYLDSIKVENTINGKKVKI